ncbi:pirin family protein [Kordiimonas sp. SCSIO 12603]|uniref:pirin family protein n=1 Tax=Kordiimonas sp. SCSIO 12603 TaxID=2829596 RepID=UPI0021055AD6|nr:pirin family protein [Kordiimonas sp. SCSIO 12603]UTW60313.1 pirin family protein [Kordiimonas sp. SCSIO 12603]
MLTVRRSEDRGYFDHGWLKSHHSFSFGDYYDPQFMGFGSLRVINDDIIAPNMGFPTHPHQEMEIVSYVVRGGLKHKDTLGNGSIIKAGDVQRMTAGTGIRHSEFAGDEEVHLYQIWILPGTKGLEPSYEQKQFSALEKQGAWKLVGSEDGRHGSVTIHQDIAMYSTLVDAGDTVSYAPEDNRKLWLQMVSGEAEVNGEVLFAGDAVAIAFEDEISFKALQDSEALLFDMAM